MDTQENQSYSTPTDAEAGLLQSERYLRSILEAITESVFLIESNGTILATNQTGAERLGVEVKDLIGQDIFSFLPPAVAEIRRQEVLHVMESGLPRQMEDQRHDFFLRSTIYPVLDENGTVTHLVIYADDITEQVKAEKEHLHLANRLQNARRMESLGILAGGIAHNFNNLLTIIIGNTELALSRVADDSDVKNLLENISTAADRATDISDQMIEFYGIGDLSFEPIDFSAFTEAFISGYRNELPEHIRLDLSLDPALPTIDGEPRLLEQMITILMTNAVEAMSEEPGVISISSGIWECDCIGYGEEFAHTCIRGMEYIYLDVIDNGIGIDEELHERIFEPFFTTKLLGRGLGLSAVLGIIQGHNGSIKVESRAGGGTIVRILLPPSGTEGLAEKNR